MRLKEVSLSTLYRYPLRSLRSSLLTHQMREMKEGGVEFQIYLEDLHNNCSWCKRVQP